MCSKNNYIYLQLKTVKAEESEVNIDTCSVEKRNALEGAIQEIKLEFESVPVTSTSVGEVIALNASSFCSYLPNIVLFMQTCVVSRSQKHFQRRKHRRRYNPKWWFLQCVRLYRHGFKRKSCGRGRLRYNCFTYLFLERLTDDITLYACVGMFQEKSRKSWHVLSVLWFVTMSGSMRITASPTSPSETHRAAMSSAKWTAAGLVHIDLFKKLIQLGVTEN